jgi:hypothetical protein
VNALYVGLDPTPECLKAVVVDRGFGHVIESFSTEWACATRTLGESLRSWEPYYPLAEIALAICPDDDFWPSQFTAHLRRLCGVHTLRQNQVSEVLQTSARILQRELKHKRANLLAFLARHHFILGDTFSGCSIDLTHRDLACAWALQITRQEMLDVELTIACGGYDVSMLNPFEPIHVVSQCGPQDPDIVPF